MGATCPRSRYFYRVTVTSAASAVREYIGRGDLAEMLAEADALRRQECQALARQHATRRRPGKRLRRPSWPLSVKTDWAPCAALLAAGYHRHDRGQWRLKRGQGRSPTPPP